LSPKQSKKYNNICPKCKKPLVIGVLNRVQELAVRPYGFVPSNAVPYKSLIPLQEVISDALGVGVASKKVAEFYDKLTQNLENEFNILLDAKTQDIEKYSLPEIAEGILRVREGKVLIEPGYDGVYGKIKIFDKACYDKPKQKILL
jgi:PHP family Zn ribbon phosphoesterase